MTASKISLQLARQLGRQLRDRSPRRRPAGAVTTPESERGTSRYLSSGPLVWAATIACTTLLLALLKQVLWLVVPFLLAIILYYALFPAVRRLTLAGVARETAAAIVAGGFFVAGAGGDGADAVVARGAGGQRRGGVLPLPRGRPAR